MSEQKPAERPADPPTRVFSVRTVGGNVDIVAHAYSVTEAGALVFTRQVLGIGFNVRAFAAGTWATLESDAPSDSFVIETLQQNEAIYEWQMARIGRNAQRGIPTFDLTNMNPRRAD